MAIKGWTARETDALAAILNAPSSVEETEKEDEPELTHWNHPTDSTIDWCGKPKSKPGFTADEVGTSPKTCPICEDLYRRFGGGWWWDTHRRYYESECHVHHNIAFHNCAGAR